MECVWLSAFVSLLGRVLVSALVQYRFGQAMELDYVGCYWVSIVIGVVGLRTMLLSLICIGVVLFGVVVMLH
jgi:hypothetical protein